LEAQVIGLFSFQLSQLWRLIYKIVYPWKTGGKYC